MKRRKCPIHGTYSTSSTCNVIVVDRDGERHRCGVATVEVDYYTHALAALLMVVALLITQINAPDSFVYGAQSTPTPTPANP